MITPDELAAATLPLPISWRIWDGTVARAEIVSVSRDGSLSIRSSDGYTAYHPTSAYIDQAALLARYTVASAECPRCQTAPAYRRRLADPWDRHDVCTECSYCYTHEH